MLNIHNFYPTNIVSVRKHRSTCMTSDFIKHRLRQSFGIFNSAFQLMGLYLLFLKEILSQDHVKVLLSEVFQY